ncbi:MAG TPA: hypothetical protein VIK18_19875 [Pirellulales bacterium]
MTSAPDQDSKHVNRAFRSPRTTILAGVLALGLLAVVTTSPRHDLGWIDPLTGSLKYQTRWLGFPTTTALEQSAIEKWLVRRDGQYSNRWVCLYDTSKKTWGQPTLFACGRAPEIYDLRAGSLNDAFAHRASDLQMDAFLHIMQVGSEAEKCTAVQTAIQKAIKGYAQR